MLISGLKGLNVLILNTKEVSEFVVANFNNIVK